MGLEEQVPERAIVDDSPASSAIASSIGRETVPATSEVTTVRDESGTHNSEPLDAVEEALATALAAATVAGRWGVVAQLAKELESRRQARSNVVLLSRAPQRRTGR